VTDVDINEVHATIKRSVVTTHGLVATAKRFVLLHPEIDNSDALVRSFQRHQDAAQPPELAFASNVDPSDQIRAVIRAISIGSAMCEAIAQLIHEGIVVRAVEQDFTFRPQLSWTIRHGGGGSSSAWSFDELALIVPARIRFAPSAIAGHDRTLSDPDLYVESAGAVDAQIAGPLREAAECYRRSLYTPALAMLAKAAEAGWSLCAEALCAEAGRDAPVIRLSAKLADPRFGLAELVRETESLYSRTDLYAELQAASGVSLALLRDVAAWTDQVRDSRNVVHFRAVPRTVNSDEKVSVLLLAAPGYLSALSRVRDAQRQLGVAPISQP
jgi:hypothetical protein